MRGRSLMFMGQGISNLGSTIGDLMLKSKESKKEQKRYDEGAPKRQLELDILGQEKLFGEKKNKAQDIALAQAEDAEKFKNAYYELNKKMASNEEYQKLAAQAIDKLAQENKGQDPTDTMSILNETIEPPMTRKQKYSEITNTVPEIVGVDNAGIQKELGYLRESEEVPGETPEQKMAREKELISFRAEEAKRTRPPKEEGGLDKREQAKYKAGAVDKETEKAVAGVYEAVPLLTSVIDQYKATSKGAGSIAGEAGANVPLIGKYIAPKSKEYQKSKETVSEVFLRVATGATAPDPEVERYAGFLPDLSDPSDLAQKKLDNFKSKIMAKAKARVKTLNATGDALIATEKPNYIEIGETKKAMAQSFMESLETELANLPSVTETRGREPTQPGTEEEELEYDPATGTFKKVRR